MRCVTRECEIILEALYEASPLVTAQDSVILNPKSEDRRQLQKREAGDNKNSSCGKIKGQLGWLIRLRQ
jgi:hypothetical protein